MHVYPESGQSPEINKTLRIVLDKVVWKCSKNSVSGHPRHLVYIYN